MELTELDRTLPPLVLIGGPTAAGKTALALALADRFPVRLISADSVQVYRGMDIGSAKPEAAILSRYPHALIDIRDPEEGYTAADFVREAGREIRESTAAGTIPVLVGGTPMYLKALRYGLDPMPTANPALRRRIERDAEAVGWAAMHHRLAELDPVIAARIRPNDPQRIERALEICLLSGRPASELQRGRGPDRMRDAIHIVICPADRGELHRRIEQRWQAMLRAGFLDEVRGLVQRPGFDRTAPAWRAVGYRQALECIEQRSPVDELARRGAAATRQLAKRQLTAFRQWTGAFWYDPLNKTTINRIIKRVEPVNPANRPHRPDVHKDRQ
ncbi:MAG: tRNA (adenosine(37)-N6)-dimethylallyltransferase MiaA [Gammaproteobacteria bacterium HGW-Gammaproteobacteria-8]|nr:MAG: tRNA (adenosine(37)-N6)-dimethylallyltransferase MiaA [Gammaproteobacteria bacterium HGW-Gammaproteobacteria-8]